MKVKYSLLSLAMSLLVTPAFADAVFTLGNSPQQPSEQNILYTTNQTGSTIFGFTNQSNTNIQFSSATDMLQVTANGQAKVTSSDGMINNLTISVPGQTFGDLILNPFKPASANDFSIMVSFSNGTTSSFGSFGSTNGNNFLTIVAPNNEAIDSVTITSKGGFQDLQQPRISSLSTGTGSGSGGGGPSSVPEPSTFLMLASGGLGVAASLRRKLRV